MNESKNKIKLTILSAISNSKYNTCATYGTNNLFTMNPGVSRHATLFLPMVFENDIMASNTTGEVCAVFTTSTSFIICTGLKKCNPTNLFK